jgi:hypothetical protein
MTLGELINFLKQYPPESKVPLGFDYPHAYRGYCDQLAFEPVENTCVGTMLAAANRALNATFEGYKGGEYKMEEWVECRLAAYGCSGESIGPILLSYMVGEYER